MSFSEGRSLLISRRIGSDCASVTNRLRPRLLAIQKTRPITYRAKVLGRALLAVRTDPNRFWMLLSGNPEVAFPSTTATIAAAATNPTPASGALPVNVMLLLLLVLQLLLLSLPPLLPILVLLLQLVPLLLLMSLLLLLARNARHILSPTRDLLNDVSPRTAITNKVDWYPVS
jgi:hypothetical protein